MNISATKVRPDICVTNPIGKYNHIILALVTSQVPANLRKTDRTDIVWDISQPDFRASGLHKSSTIRLDHVMTVRKSLIRRELGAVSSDTQDQIA